MSSVYVCPHMCVSLLVWMWVCLWVYVCWFSALLINRPSIALGYTVIIKTPTSLFHLKIISLVKWSKILAILDNISRVQWFLGEPFVFICLLQAAIISQSYYVPDIIRDTSCVFSLICIDLCVLSLSIDTQEHLRKLEGLGSGYINRRWQPQQADFRAWPAVLSLYQTLKVIRRVLYITVCIKISIND